MLKLVGLGVSLVSYEPAAFRRLCVETCKLKRNQQAAVASRLQAAVC